MRPEYKEKITRFYERNRRMPHYSEMMEIFGFKSKNAVFKLVEKLIGEGIVEKDAKGKLVPTRSLQELPLLGLVEAGFPNHAEETRLDTMSLDDYLIEHRESTYLLEVKGDSMIEAGIHEGDLVLAERRGEPKEGDIVIAEVDGGWTMKYYRKKNGKIFLEPANKNYKPIYPEETLHIAAIVKGVIRKY